MTTICIDCRYIGRRYSGIAEVLRGLIDLMPLRAPDLDFLLLRNPAHPGPLSAAANVSEVVVPQAAKPVRSVEISREVDKEGKRPEVGGGGGGGEAGVGWKPDERG